MTEHQSAQRVADLYDASGVPTWLIKGGGAESWLGSQGAKIPQRIYATTRTVDDAWITRTGRDEFLIESATGSAHQLHHQLASQQLSIGDCFAMECQDAVFCLTGAQVCDVMSQTCGINWDEVPAEQLVMTRVAGVNCGVRRRDGGGDAASYVLRFDPSYAAYLWEELLAICQEYGGVRG